MTDAHQCPSCELKFRNRAELDYHWTEEHGPPVAVELPPEPAPDPPDQGRPAV